MVEAGKLLSFDANGKPKGRAWRTQDGRVIKIKKMSDEHLENTIRFLERRGVRTEHEQVTDPVAQTEAMMCGHSVTTRCQYEAMLEERERRAKVSAENNSESGARRELGS